MRRLSGLQKSVIALYRDCLREARNKPHASYLVSCWRPETDNFPAGEGEFQEFCEVGIMQHSNMQSKSPYISLIDIPR